MSHRSFTSDDVSPLPSPPARMPRIGSLPSLTGIHHKSNSVRNIDGISALPSANLNFTPIGCDLPLLNQRSITLPAAKHLKALLQRFNSWSTCTAITRKRRQAITRLLQKLRREIDNRSDSCYMCTDSLDTTNITYSEQCGHGGSCFECYLKWCNLDRSCPLCRMPVAMLVFDIKSVTEFRLLNVSEPKWQDGLALFRGLLEYRYASMNNLRVIIENGVRLINDMHLVFDARKHEWEKLRVTRSKTAEIQSIRRRLNMHDFAWLCAVSELVGSFDEACHLPSSKEITDFSQEAGKIQAATTELARILMPSSF